MTEATDRIEEVGPRRFHPYPGYKDSGVEWLDEIPAHWKVKRLKNSVARLESGGTPESDNVMFWTDEEHGIPWVAISDMTRGFRLDVTSKRITEEGRKSKRLRVLPAGTLLYSMYASLGKVALLETEAAVNQAILGVIPREGEVLRDYLRWWFEFMQGHIQMLSSSNTQDNLSAERVRNMPVVLPAAIEEQHAIAAFLDRETAKIDELVARKERLIELLQEKRVALITRAVTRGLDPNVPMKDSGVEWLGEIPTHWELKPVGRLADSLVGFPFPSGRYSFGSGVPLVRGDNITSGSLRWGTRTRYWPEDPPHDRYFLSARDVIIGMDGSKVGRNYALINDNDLPLLLVQRVTRLRMKNDNDAPFVFFSITNPRFHAHVDTHRTDPAIPHITLKDILSFSIPVPPTKEQRAISAFLDRKKAKLDALMAKVEIAVNHLNEYRTTLISAAVTGKIDVRRKTHEPQNV